jgi:hypothetical protein
MKFGFLSMENESESVSKTLEYAYNDWCIARIAEMLGRDSLAKVFYRRSGAWINLFDPETGHMRPRNYGRWLAPFDAKEVNNHYTEANSWHYSFSVPHDIQGWMEILSSHGAHSPEAMLDSLFTTSSITTGREQADITGMIGQYAHGNEPSHHIAYLYNSVGKPYKTQQRVKQILETQYSNRPEGLSGNEDCGQMSAWYVLSSLGFYPVCPGDATYCIGYPLFKTATIKFENGKILKMTKKGKGDFIRAISLNGVYFEPNYITQYRLLEGGNLVFTMSKKPTNWGTGHTLYNEGCLVHKVNNSYLTWSHTTYSVAPFLTFDDIAFKDTMKVGINNYYDSGFNIRLIKDNKIISEISVNGKDTNLVLNESICVEASRGKGSIARSCFFKRPNNWKVTLLNPVNKQYTAGGASALTDGIKGDAEWRKGHWQGIQGMPFEAVIDLGDTQTISSVHAGFLQDTRSWIVFPRNVSYTFSLDGVNWGNAAGTINTYPVDSLESQRKTLSTYIKPVQARYIKIRAAQYGTLPEWHPGAGGETFIFIDELTVNKP